jgi:uncharacterized protein involved in exopolysaccharide biosynthesis
MGKNKEKYDFSANNLIAYVAKRFKTLLKISILGAVVTAIITLFIHNQYKSSFILFPASPVNVARSITDINYGYVKGDFLSVGSDEEVDELMQVLNSSDIIVELISKFDLAKHYKIDLNKKGAYTKLYKAVSSNVKINKTEYTSVSVEVWDEDPKLSYDMSNEIMDLVDTVFNRMQKDRIVKAYNLAQCAYDSLYKHIGMVQDSLTKLNKMGLLDYQYQTQEVTKAYYKALMAGKTDLANKIEKQIKLMENYGSRTMTLRDEIAYTEKNLGDLSGKLTIAKVAMKSKISPKYVVTKPGIPDYKSYPKRMLIVLVAGISTFFVALFAFIVIENLKKVI